MVGEGDGLVWVALALGLATMLALGASQWARRSQTKSSRAERVAHVAALALGLATAATLGLFLFG